MRQFTKQQQKRVYHRNMYKNKMSKKMRTSNALKNMMFIFTAIGVFISIKLMRNINCNST